MLTSFARVMILLYVKENMKTDQLLAYLASSEVGIRYAIDKIFSEQNDFQEVLLDFLRENIEDSQIQDTIEDDNFKRKYLI